jgi:predicted permease
VYYIITTLRHLWRQRLFTVLNVLGLAVSISVCWMAYLIVSHEYSYDKKLPDKKNIYRVVTGMIYDEKEMYNGGVSKPLYQALRKEATGLQRVVPLMGQYIKAVQVNDATAKPLVVENPTSVAATDSAYFSMVPYSWLAGNKNAALNAPNQVVLTESRARQYFPNKKPQEILNRTLTYFGEDTVTRTVSGIVADREATTEFTAKEFCSLSQKEYELNEWTNTSSADKLYLQLQENAVPAKVLATVENMVSQKTKEFYQTQKNSFKWKRWFQLLPLSESHFATYFRDGDAHKANKKILYGLMGMAAFLLLLACINYINMGVASIPGRAKEIGVRKTLGSSRRALVGQFLLDTLVTALLACIAALYLLKIEFYLLKNIIPEGIGTDTNILQSVVFLLLLSIAITLLSGLYPGWLITKVKTVNVFRNAFVFKNSGGRISLQKALIVFQFAIAIIFITGALVVGRQLHYAVYSDMGFNKDAVVLASVPWKYSDDEKYQDKQFPLLTELKKIQGIKNIALGNEPLSSSSSSSQFSYYPEGKEPVAHQIFTKNVDTGFLNLYGFKLIAGRNIHASDTTNELVINETAVKAYGFASAQDAIGKVLGYPNWTVPIVGVVKDFHTKDFYTTIDPMAFMTRKNLLTFNIKLDNANAGAWQQTLKAVEKKWNEFYPPGSFSYKFYDETIEAMYKEERNLAMLINLTTGIAIFISCLGLFGLVVFTAYQRTKEIGIRKVLGASVFNIVQLLSKDYLKPVVIAIFIATPVSWWAMNKWLQGFVYRISLQWWMFALAGIAAVLIALITVSAQAIKAASANPVKSIKTE